MKRLKVKRIKIIAAVLVVISLIGLTVSLTIGGSEQNKALAQESQIATVQRGNLSLEITAAGNLALSRTEDLGIDLFYGQSGASGTKGTVGEVLVEEGDSVKEGQVLAKLDTTEWDKQLKTLEKALLTSQRNLTSKERALTKAEAQVITEERDVTKAERQVTAKELAVRDAELDLQTAEDNLYKTKLVKSEKDAVDTAEYELKVAQVTGEWRMALVWTEKLAQAKEDLQEILKHTGVTNISTTSSSSDVEFEFAKCQLAVEQCQELLEDAQVAVEDANLALDEAKLDKEYAAQDLKDAQAKKEEAEQDVEDAQSDLDEAKSLSPIIVAPFDGFITQVNVKGGDEVLKGTVAMQIADPNKFEAEIAVSEIDISQVKVGGEARVDVDALGLSLPAAVTYIAPTATIQSGVVNYKVTVEVQSTPTALAQPPAASDNTTMMPPTAASDNITMMPPTTAGDNITMMPPTGIQNATGNATGQGAATTRMAAAVADYSQLREGMTVTVNLIVAQRQNVLLVPYAAITTERGQKYVQVVSATGTTEKRAITTGITDYQYTEVTEGLSEGEKVVVSQSAKTTTTTTQQQQPGGIMIPGMGGGSPPGG